MEPDESRLFFEFANLVATTDKIEDILAFVLKSFRDLTNSPRIALDLIAHNGVIDLQLIEGLPHRLLNWQVNEGMTGWVFTHRQALMIADTRQDQRYRPARQGVHSALVAPLLFQNTLIGVVNLESSQLAAFTDVHQRLLLTMAPLLAICVENRRLIDTQLERQSEQLRSLLEVGQAIAASTAQPDDILKQIVDNANRLLDADISVLYRFDRHKQQFLPNPIISGSLLQAHLVVKVAPRPSGGMAARVRDEDVVVVEDLQTAPDRASSFTQAEQISSFIGVALKAGSDFIGVLYVNFRTPHRFPTHERFVIRAFAEQAAIAVRKARLLEQFTILNDMAQRLNRSAQRGDFFQTVYQEVSRLLNTEYFVITRYHETAETIDLWMMEQGKERLLENQDIAGLTGWVIRERRPLLIADTYQDKLPAPPLQHFTRDQVRPRSYLLAPLLVGDRILGVITLLTYEPFRFQPADAHLLNLIAAHVAIALDNQQLYQAQEQILQVGQVLTGALKIDDVLKNILQTAQRALDANIVVLYQYYADEDHFASGCLLAGALLDPTFPEGQQVTSDEIAYLLVQSGRSHYASQARNDDIMSGPIETRRPGRFVMRERIRSSAGIVLRVQNEIVGVMFINYRNYQAFDIRQRNQIELFANYAAAAIARVRLTEDIRRNLDRRLAEVRALTDIDRAITSSRLLEVFTKILDAAMAITNNQRGRGNIFLVDKSSEYLEAPVALRGEGRIEKLQRFQIGKDGIVGYVALHKQPTRVSNLQSKGWWNEWYIPSFADTRSELAVPMLDENGILLGVINLESPHVDAFSEEDQELLVALAEQASIAAQSTQRFTEMQRVRQELEALSAVNQALSSTLDLEEVLQLIIDKGTELIRAPLFQVMLYNEKQESWYIAAERSMFAQQRYERQSLQVGVTGYVARERQTVRIDDVLAPEWQGIYHHFTAETRAELAAPMIQGNRLVGVLNVESPEIGFFSTDDERLLNALAGQAAVAVRNAELYRQAVQNAEIVVALRSIDAAINQHEELLQVMRLVIEESMRLTSAERGDIMIYHAEQNELELWVSVDHIQPAISPNQEQARSGRFNANDSIIGQVAITRQPYISHGDVQQDTTVRYVGDADIHAEIAVPLFVEQSFVGVLNLESRTVNRFDDDDLQVLLTFAGQAQLAIRDARHREEIALANQRRQEALYMENVGASAMEMAHRIGNSLGTIKTYIDEIQDVIGAHDSVVNQRLNDILRDTRIAIELEKRFKEALASDQDLAAKKEKILVHSILFQASRAYPTPQQVQVIINCPAQNLFIDADARIHDVFINLFTNAVQALERQGGLIELGAHLTDYAIELWVKDNGPGIPDAQQSTIFDLFVSSRPGGIGFGLWNARRIILAHGGEITVESAVGQGATFRVELRTVRLGI